MPTNRRDFVKASAALAAVTGARAAFGQPVGGYLANPSSDAIVDDLALEALNAAQAAGASYADARIGRYRRQCSRTGDGHWGHHATEQNAGDVSEKKERKDGERCDFERAQKGQLAGQLHSEQSPGLV